MKKSAVKSERNQDKSISIFALMGILLAGVLAGTLMYCNIDEQHYQNIAAITGGLLENRMNYSFTEMLVNSFAGSFLLIVLCFILGTGPVFQPVELLIPVYRGLGLGILLADMYCSFGSYGIIISVLLILPNAVVSAFILLIAVRESIRMSNSVRKVVFKSDSSYSKIDFSLYFTKFIVIITILSLSSLADSVVTVFLSDYIIK